MTSGTGQCIGPVRVALVGSRYDMIARLEARLDARPQIEVVGSFPTRREARDGVPAVDPEVVIVDADLVDGSGSQVCADLRLAGCELACLVLSGLPLFDERDEFGDDQAVAAVDAVVLKSLTDDVLVQEIIRLAQRPTGGGGEA